jgi:hypothetical protein
MNDLAQGQVFNAYRRRTSRQSRIYTALKSRAVEESAALPKAGVKSLQ